MADPNIAALNAAAGHEALRERMVASILWVGGMPWTLRAPVKKGQNGLPKVEVHQGQGIGGVSALLREVPALAPQQMANLKFLWVIRLYDEGQPRSLYVARRVGGTTHPYTTNLRDAEEIDSARTANHLAERHSKLTGGDWRAVISAVVTRLESPVPFSLSGGEE